MLYVTRVEAALRGGLNMKQLAGMKMWEDKVEVARVSLEWVSVDMIYVARVIVVRVGHYMNYVSRLDEASLTAGSVGKLVAWMIVIRSGVYKVEVTMCQVAMLRVGINCLSVEVGMKYLDWVTPSKVFLLCQVTH